MKIHIFHTGEVRVSPYLPFGGDNCSLFKASGLTTPKNKWMWLPVSCYLIEHPKGRILVDCGWHRDISPDGKFCMWTQMRSLGSPLLYMVNQARLPLGQAIDEQLANNGLKPSDIDIVLLTHLDCDHAHGLRAMHEAKRIMVAKDELACARRNGLVRYQKKWWKGVELESFDWNATEGPAHKSYDLFGDGSVSLVNIPGHADGLFAVKLKNTEGKFVLLFSDGGYATRSWKEMITSGISLDKVMQRKSLEWIRQQSMDKNCVVSIANHDPDVQAKTIEL
ncbi:MAG: N-acyl homoserine lactonase family protein [Bacteroidales bacterium]|nr:N-acyl homoserine lactonase family protein [Bacteroidales bacterium]